MVRRVQALAPQELAHLAGLGAPVRFFDDPQLVCQRRLKMSQTWRVKMLHPAEVFRASSSSTSPLLLLSFSSGVKGSTP